MPLLLLAAMLALSYTFPQASAYIRSDPITYEEWLSNVQTRYRRWTPFLRTVGVFHVRDTPWFRVLLALLALVLLVSAGDYAGQLAEEWQVRHPASFYNHGGKRLAIALAVDEAADRVKGALGATGLRVSEVRDLEATYLRAQRRALARVDVLLSLLGALALATALGTNSRWGWTQEDIQVLPNRAVAVGPQGDHRLELLQQAEGSRGVWIEIDATQRLFVDGERGASSGAFRYELTDQGGPLVSVSASNRDGAPLDLSEYMLRPEPQSELQLVFSSASEEQAVRLFLLPETKTVVRLEWQNRQASGAGLFYFRQWAFEQGAQQLVGTAEIGSAEGIGTTQIGEVTYHWVFSSYAVLDVAYRPGRWLLGVGVLLALSGMVAQFVPRQQAWAMLHTTEEGSLIVLREQSEHTDLRQEAPSDVVLKALTLDTEHATWS